MKHQKVRQYTLKTRKFINWLESIVEFDQTDQQEYLDKEINGRYNHITEGIKGWCSAKTMHVLNTGVQMCQSNEYYLEVGSYKGRSLCGALLGHTDKYAHVFEPFEFHLPDGKDVFKQFISNIVDFDIIDNVTYYRQKWEDFEGSFDHGIGLAFVDGNHDSGHTHIALEKLVPHLGKSAIIIVDDYEIEGGVNQTPYPGYDVEYKMPVKTDTDRWIKENKESATLEHILPWDRKVAVIRWNGR